MLMLRLVVLLRVICPDWMEAVRVTREPLRETSSPMQALGRSAVGRRSPTGKVNLSTSGSIQAGQKSSESESDEAIVDARRRTIEPKLTLWGRGEGRGRAFWNVASVLTFISVRAPAPNARAARAVDDKDR